jgi:hypothetical protein
MLKIEHGFFLNTDLHELDGWVLRRGRVILWEFLGPVFEKKKMMWFIWEHRIPAMSAVARAPSSVEGRRSLGWGI